MALIYDSSHSGQEIDAAVDAVQTTIPSQLTQIGSNIDELELNTTATSFKDDTFIVSGMYHGAFLSNNKRVASNTIWKFPVDVTLTAAQGFRFGIHIFENGTFSKDPGWQTSYQVAENTTFKIVIAREEPETVISSEDIPTFVSAVTFKSVLSNISDIEKRLTSLPLNLKNIGICYSFDGNGNSVTNNYVTLIQNHRYRFTIEFKNGGTLGNFCNVKLMSDASLSSVQEIISLKGITISANQTETVDLTWTNASVENYRLGIYETSADGRTALKGAIVSVWDISNESLGYPYTRVGFLSVHDDAKIDFTDSTIVIPKNTRVIYKVAGYSYSSTSSAATTIQRDSNYEQIICFNHTDKEFVARGIASVQEDDYILFLIQNSNPRTFNRTTLSPALYTINGVSPFIMNNEGLYKSAQTLSDTEKAQVLTNLGIAWAKDASVRQLLSYPSKIGSIPNVKSYTNTYVIKDVDLVRGHTYYARIVASTEVSAPADFNLKIVNSTSDATVYRIMTLGGLTFTEKDMQFVWDNDSVNGYRVGFFGNGAVNAEIEVLLKDITIDTVKSDVVSRNKHKEASLVSVCAHKGTENIKVADKLTLIHFSDIHGNTSNLANVVEFGGHYADLFDDIIHTGDSVHTKYDDANPFESVDGAASILNVIGNHEAWLSTSESDYNATEKQTYDKIFAPSIANWGVVQPSGATENGYCYYYKDYSQSGFRIIVLDSVHWHYRNGVSQTNDAQKMWFESVLADAITQNLKVVCATHYTPQNGINPVVDTGFNALGVTSGSSIADGWYAVDEMYVCVDTFINNGGKFAGWICGHTHEDYFGTVYGHTNQPIVVVGTARGSGSINNKFLAGTVSQDNFNVITFETLNSKNYIKIVKIGQDTDIYTRSKKTICYNFTDSALVSTT